MRFCSSRSHFSRWRALRVSSATMACSLRVSASMSACWRESLRGGGLDPAGGDDAGGMSPNTPNAKTSCDAGVTAVAVVRGVRVLPRTGAAAGVEGVLARGKVEVPDHLGAEDQGQLEALAVLDIDTRQVGLVDGDHAVTLGDAEHGNSDVGLLALLAAHAPPGHVARHVLC